nr:uncharacterized protein LOC128703813 [Cherax quadricarinatus]
MIFKWAMGSLFSAVCEHRWDDAFQVLPCIILRLYTVPLDFLWKVVDIITRKATGISLSRRHQLRSVICNMHMITYEVVLDSLSQDLEVASDADVDVLLQMLEEYCRQKNWAKTLNDPDQKRLKALSEGYYGQVLYYRWKNGQFRSDAASVVTLQDNEVSSSQTSDKDGQITLGNFGNETSSAGNASHILAKQSYTKMRNALVNLKEPCEWLMESFLDLEYDLYGIERALKTLKGHLLKNSGQLPALRLSYYFFINKDPGDIESLMTVLQKISEMCPDDPLVLEYVDYILKFSDKDTVGQSSLPGDIVNEDSDSGLDEFEKVETESSSYDATRPCLLKSRENVNALSKCLKLLTLMLEYKEFVWDLQPWQRLTNVLRRFHLAWLRFVLYFNYSVFLQILMHLKSLDYVMKIENILRTNGYRTLAVELDVSICYSGPFLDKFISYLDLRRRVRHDGNETDKTSDPYKGGLSQVHTSVCLPAENSNSSSAEECTSTKDQLKIKKDVDLLPVNSLESKVFSSSYPGSEDLQYSQCLLTDKKDSADVSFNEQDILITSTQIRKKKPMSSISSKVLNSLQNGSFTEFIDSPVEDVDDTNSLCMENDVKCTKFYINHTKQHVSETQSTIGSDEIYSKKFSQNTVAQEMSEEKVTTRLQGGKETVLHHLNSVKKKLGQEQEVHHYAPETIQRLSFESHNFSLNNNNSNSNNGDKLELCTVSEPEEEYTCFQSKSVSKDKEDKLSLEMNRGKEKTVVAPFQTSPNQEHQSRDLAMEFEEDVTCNPQSHYTCTLADNLLTCFDEGTPSNEDCDITNQSYPDEVKYCDMPSGIKFGHSQSPDPHTENVSNAVSCQDCENNVLHECHVDINVVQNSKIYNSDTNKDQNKLARDSEENVLTSGVESEEREYFITCGQRECQSSNYEAEISQKQEHSFSQGNSEKVDDSMCFQFTQLPELVDPDAYIASSHNDFNRSHVSNGETLDHLSAEFIDNGTHIVPETLSLSLRKESDISDELKINTQIKRESSDEGSFITENLRNDQCSGNAQTGNSQEENIVSETQQSVKSSFFFITPAQRVTVHDLQGSQALLPSADINTNIVDVCKTEEELYLDNESEELPITEEKNDILHSTHLATLASVSSSLSVDNNFHQLVTPPKQGPNMFSDDSSDQFHSAKSALERLIQSQIFDTPAVNQGNLKEPCNSEDFVGPSQDVITSITTKTQLSNYKAVSSSSSDEITVHECVIGSDFDTTSLPSIQETPLPLSQQPPHASVTNKVQVDEDNILEVTLLPGTNFTNEEELEFFSEQTSVVDTDCMEPLNVNLHDLSSSKKIDEAQNPLHLETVSEKPSMVKMRMEHVSHKHIQSDQDSPKKEVNNEIFNTCLEGNCCQEDTGIKIFCEPWEPIENSNSSNWDLQNDVVMEGDAEGDINTKSKDIIHKISIDVEIENNINRIQNEGSSSGQNTKGNKVEGELRTQQVRNESTESDKAKRKQRTQEIKTKNTKGDEAKGKQMLQRVRTKNKYSAKEYWNQFLDDLPIPACVLNNKTGCKNVNVDNPNIIHKDKEKVTSNSDKSDVKQRKLPLKNDFSFSWIEDLPLPQKFYKEDNLQSKLECRPCENNSYKKPVLRRQLKKKVKTIAKCYTSCETPADNEDRSSNIVFSESFSSLLETVQNNSHDALDPLNDKHRLIHLETFDDREDNLVVKKVSKRKLKAIENKIHEENGNTSVTNELCLLNEAEGKSEKQNNNKGEISGELCTFDEAFQLSVKQTNKKRNAKELCLFNEVSEKCKEQKKSKRRDSSISCLSDEIAPKSKKQKKQYLKESCPYDDVAEEFIKQENHKGRDSGNPGLLDEVAEDLKNQKNEKTGSKKLCLSDVAVEFVKQKKSKRRDSKESCLFKKVAGESDNQKRSEVICIFDEGEEEFQKLKQKKKRKYEELYLIDEAAQKSINHKKDTNKRWDSEESYVFDEGVEESEKQRKEKKKKSINKIKDAEESCLDEDTKESKKHKKKKKDSHEPYLLNVVIVQEIENKAVREKITLNNEKPDICCDRSEEIDSSSTKPSHGIKRKSKSRNKIVGELSSIQLPESSSEPQCKERKRKSLQLHLISEAEKSGYLESNELSKKGSKQKLNGVVKKKKKIHSGIKSVKGLKSIIGSSHRPESKLKRRKIHTGIKRNFTQPYNNGFNVEVIQRADDYNHFQEETKKQICNVKEDIKQDVTFNMISKNKNKIKTRTTKVKIREEKSIKPVFEEERNKVPERLCMPDYDREVASKMSKKLYSSSDVANILESESGHSGRERTLISAKNVCHVDKSFVNQEHFDRKVSNKGFIDKCITTDKSVSKTTKQPFSEYSAKSSNINLCETLKTCNSVSFKSHNSYATNKRKIKDSVSKIKCSDYPEARTSNSNDEELSNLPISDSFPTNRIKSRHQQSESQNKTDLSVMYVHPELNDMSSSFSQFKRSLVNKKAGLLSTNHRLSQKWKECEPSPPWQNASKFRGKYHKLFNPNDELLS